MCYGAQGHHQRPWTITKREFCNNLHQVFRPAAVPAALSLALSPWSPLWWNAFSGSFMFLCCMSQQFHAWAHMKKSELPAVVLALQVCEGLLGAPGNLVAHETAACWCWRRYQREMCL